MLASGRDVAELGTAFGEGAAAIAETARSLVTVESDPERAAVARERLAAFANVEALEGDATSSCADAGRSGSCSRTAASTTGSSSSTCSSPAALLVKDDLTPGRAIDGDPVREFLLRDPRLAAVEILTTPASAAIVAVRRR